MEDQGKLTQRFTERAIDFIDRNKSNPFLMVLAHPMPHVPLAVSSAFHDSTGLGIYADVILEIDWSVGQVLQKLKTEGLENNTLVIFTTDNGPWLRYGTHGGSNGGLREGKTTMFDGGSKVPGIIKWPIKIQAGSVYDEMASSIDILPTIAELTGVQLPNQSIDGISMSQVIYHGVLDRPYRREYYFYRNGDLFGVRLNDQKYLLEHNYDPVALMTIRNDGRHGISQSVTFDGGLFDLAEDAGEMHNLLSTSNIRLIDLFEAKADSVKLLLGSRKEGIIGSAIR
jgi:arylsulfatase